jgi:hypothetical protein
MDAVVMLTYGPLYYLFEKGGELEHDYESGGTGGNRFATILLYMSDIGPEDGGETVFPKGWPPGVAVEDRVDSKTVREGYRFQRVRKYPFLTYSRRYVS